MKIRKLVYRALVIWIVLLVLLLSSDPNKLPVVAVIVPFILLFVAIFDSWRLLMLIWARWRQRQEVPELLNQTGAILATCLTVMLVLQSLGQLTLRDALTLVLLLVAGYLYLRRMLPNGR